MKTLLLLMFFCCMIEQSVLAKESTYVRHIICSVMDRSNTVAYLVDIPAVLHLDLVPRPHLALEVPTGKINVEKGLLESTEDLKLLQASATAVQEEINVEISDLIFTLQPKRLIGSLGDLYMEAYQNTVQGNQPVVCSVSPDSQNLKNHYMQ